MKDDTGDNDVTDYESTDLKRPLCCSRQSGESAAELLSNVWFSLFDKIKFVGVHIQLVHLYCPVHVNVLLIT